LSSKVVMAVFLNGGAMVGKDVIFYGYFAIMVPL